MRRNRKIYSPDVFGRYVSTDGDEHFDEDPFKPKNHLNFSDIDSKNVISHAFTDQNQVDSPTDFSNLEISENGPKILNVDGTFIHFSEDPLSSRTSELRNTPSSRFDPSINSKIRNSPLNNEFSNSKPTFFSNEEKPSYPTFIETPARRSSSSSRKSIIPLSPEEIKNPTFTEDQNSQIESENIAAPASISLISGSPIRGPSPGKVSYNLDNLPSEAFAYANEYEKEEEITPLILECPLTPRLARRDTESDFDFEVVDFKKDDFFNFIGDDISKQLRSRVWKQKVKGLNEIQQMFRPEKDLDDYAEIMFFGLQTAPGFKDMNVAVNQVLIDLLRHIIVKSENIKKSTISIIVPFLVEKISDQRLRVPICELMLIISEAICPSFVLLEFLSVAISRRNQKNVACVLDISVEIVKLYGPGDLVLEKYIPLLIDALNSTNPDAKKYAIELSVCLSLTYKETIEGIANKLPNSLKNRFVKELESAKDLQPPSRTFYRQREQRKTVFNDEPKAKKIVPQKLSDLITQEQCIAAESATKFADQRYFLTCVDNAIESSNNRIVSSDLELIIKVLKKFVLEGNKNIILLSLQLLDKLATCSDSGISKWSHYVAPCVTSAWCDQRQAIREEATKVGVAFGSPQSFIKMILLMSSVVSQTRLEILKYIEGVSKSLSEAEYNKLSDFVASSFEDKNSDVRKLASEVAELFVLNAPDSFKNSVAKLSQQAQKRLQKLFKEKEDEQKEVKLNDEPQVVEPVQQQQTPVVQQVDNEPKFSISPSKPKKDRRIAGFTDFLTTKLTENEKILSLTEKTKIDAQISLPPVIYQHLFSNLVSEQNSAFNELNILLKTDAESIYQCSDIFVRIAIIRIYGKTAKIANLAINFLQSIFSAEYPISIQELQMLIPVLLWSYDNNSAVADDCDELLFSFRTTINSHDLSEIYISQIPSVGVNGLTTVFTELQFTAARDPKLALDLFAIAVNYVQSDNDALNKACGGLLCAISGMISNSEKEGIIKKLDRGRQEAVLGIIPIDNAKIEFSFVGFSNLTSRQKLEALKKVDEVARERAGRIEFSISDILDEFVREKIDWSIIKSLLFSIHEIVSYCSVEKDDLEKLFSIVCFFSNRRQKQILLIHGGSQLIDAVVFQFTKRLDVLSILQVIYEGMISFTISLSPECFYCKLWVAILSQMSELTKDNEETCKEIANFAYSKLDECSESPLLQRLLKAVIIKCDMSPDAEEETSSGDAEEIAMNQPQMFTPRKERNPTKVVSPLLETARYISPRKKSSDDVEYSFLSKLVPENGSFSEPKKRRKSKLPPPTKLRDSLHSGSFKPKKTAQKKKEKKPIKFTTQTFNQVDVEPEQKKPIDEIVDDSSFIEGDNEDIFKSPQRKEPKSSHFSPQERKKKASPQQNYVTFNEKPMKRNSTPIKITQFNDFLNNDSSEEDVVVVSGNRKPAIVQERKSPVKRELFAVDDSSEESDDELPIFNKNLSRISPKKHEEEEEEAPVVEEKHTIIEIPEEFIPKQEPPLPKPTFNQSQRRYTLDSHSLKDEEEEESEFEIMQPKKTQKKQRNTFSPKKMHFIEKLSPAKDLDQPQEDAYSPAQKVARSRLSFLPSQETSNDESDDFFPPPVVDLLPVSPSRPAAEPRLSKNIANLWKTI